MEAARLIQNAGIRPRRTIRVAIWSGEEEGLPGSLAYVKAHFGTAEAPKPEWFKPDAYLNVDTGTGRIRGASVFGPAEAAAVIRSVPAQFADWGVGGALPTSSRAVGGMTHHTNLDTYERIVAGRCEEGRRSRGRSAPAPRESGPYAAAVHEGNDARAGRSSGVLMCRGRFRQGAFACAYLLPERLRIALCPLIQ
jgi:hypothetical protein